MAGADEPDRLVSTHLEALDDALIIAAGRFGDVLGGDVGGEPGIAAAPRFARYAASRARLRPARSRRPAQRGPARETPVCARDSRLRAPVRAAGCARSRGGAPNRSSAPRHRPPMPGRTRFRGTGRNCARPAARPNRIRQQGLRTVIDGAGRLVVPKAARDELGLTAGTELELRIVDSRVEIEVPPTPMRLVEADRGPVAVTDREMPVLTTEMVRETLERIRR